MAALRYREDGCRRPVEKVREGPVPEIRVDLMHDNGKAVSTDPLRVGIFLPLHPIRGKSAKEVHG